MLKEFGKHLKGKRLKLKQTQRDIADKTELAREQISRIENGLINPTLETLVKLSNALNIPLRELLDFEYKVVTESNLKPFVKWAGGKTQLLNEIKELMPKQYNVYFEPFIGGGALFFNLKPNNAVISDYNEELMLTYKSFKNNADYNNMINEIVKHENNHSEEYYLEIRAMDRDESYKNTEIYIKAARMIYLNKACFNGLYRVNSKGYFNVPSGKKKEVKAYQEILFNDINNYFNKSDIKIMSKDFEEVVALAKKGDFVYFDPPYDTFENKNNFTSYTKDSFGREEQMRLGKVFKELDRKGVYVMLSNHNTNFIKELYKDYNLTVVLARRMINSNAKGRGKVEEVIITNY